MTMHAGSRVACTLVLILGFAASGSAQAPAGAVVTFAESVEWTEMVPGVSFGPVYGDWTVGPTCVSEEPCLFYTHGDHLWDMQAPEEGS